MIILKRVTLTYATKRLLHTERDHEDNPPQPAGSQTLFTNANRTPRQK